MPYIDQDERDVLDPFIEKLHTKITGGGQMNYAITRLLFSWYKQNPCYFSICKVMGTLLCVALEFYRRVAVRYENQKRDENGEVYK